jgi:hypothetical protein
MKRVFGYVLAPSPVNSIGNMLIKLLAIVYLIAIVPLWWQVVPLIGENGLLPAKDLLSNAWKTEGVWAIYRFPSLFWIYPANVTLKVLVIAGCGGALLMLTRWKFQGSFIAWICFLSLCTIAGDFLVIIIDLFLAETGFLVIWLAWFIQYKNYVPRVVHWAFLTLNFRLWFCMGVNKFLHPTPEWSEFTFFDYFFSNQPMPAPLAWYGAKLPHFLHVISIAGIAIAEIPLPFLIFGTKGMRWVAFFVLNALSVSIIIFGNYGYFNWLSIVISLFILRDTDIKYFRNKSMATVISFGIWPQLIAGLVSMLILLQIMYVGLSFDKEGRNRQYHFNYPFYYKSTESLHGVFSGLNTVLKITANARMVTPYGLFSSIPKKRIELRFLVSSDSVNWEPVRFKYVPSSNTQYMKWFAPYYPRLDHLMFYETVGAGNYLFNPVNIYYRAGNNWTCRFIQALKNKDQNILSLIEKTPVTTPIKYVKVEAWKLRFTTEDERNKRGDIWVGEYCKTVYNGYINDPLPCRPLLTAEDVSKF